MLFTLAILARISHHFGFPAAGRLVGHRGLPQPSLSGDVTALQSGLRCVREAL